MTFLLHLPEEARSLLHGPLSHRTCEFVVQVCFECSCPAVLRALVNREAGKVSKTDWNKTFGGVQK